MVFIRHSVHLTNGQLNKLRTAAKGKKAASIQVNPRLKANHHLYLTPRQKTKLGKNKRPTRIKLSKTQMAKNGGKRGGFVISVPLALSALGALGSLAGGAATVAKSVNAVKSQAKKLAESKRHNARVENLLKAAKTGRGKKRGKGSFLPGGGRRRRRR